MIILFILNRLFDSEELGSASDTETERSLLPLLPMDGNEIVQLPEFYSITQKCR